jgi:UPF0042 nucleotide-binding protein
MRTVVVVTGLSGAGKSQALHALEDLGFFCIDNLPTLLAPRAVALCERGGMTRIGLGIDARVGAFLGKIGDVLGQLESGVDPDSPERGSGGERDVHVIFLDASDETLLRRFNESRRPHPLGADQAARGLEGGAAVLDGVRIERERLASLRARATRVIDTTSLSVHELRRLLIAHFGPASGGAPRMTTRIVSFGFKFGAPVDADLVLDVRFLDNPYFVPELKPLTGLDAPVAKFVLELPETVEFMKRTRDLLAFVMPKYEREGKSYLTIAIGCTGGKHRSVAIAEALARDLEKPLGTPITVVHRDLGRATLAGQTSADASTEDGPAIPDDRPSASELKGASTPPPAVSPRVPSSPSRGAR